MAQKVVAINQKSVSEKASKTVAANQKSVDELPLESGTWRIAGVPGLYVRCRARSKSYFIQRKVAGRVVKESLGELPLKRARVEAMRVWAQLKPKPAAHDVTTLGDAFEQYLEQKDLAEKTRHNYSYNLKRYLSDWKKRSLHDIGNDRPGVRRLERQITKEHGKATWNQVMRLLSAVYRWQRKVDPTLPEPPTVAVEVHRLQPRDWAMSPEQLKVWWETTETSEDGTQILLGVKHLPPVRRTWWLVALLTGARKRSIEALKWDDVDFGKQTIAFRVTKGDRPYAVPMSDKLADLLSGYRDCGKVPPSEWLFPSNARPDRHLVDVRDNKNGVPSAHRLRHTFRTTLAELGASPDQARLLMGHSMGGDVSRGYITAPLLVESLRPIANAVAQRYTDILGEVVLTEKLSAID